MNRRVAEWIGTIFYVGKLPLAPGTWASIFATATWYFIFQDKDPIILPVITGFIFLLGTVASDTIVRDSKDYDPEMIVIDEWVGQWVTFTLMPVNIYTALIGLLAFRVFDITKFGPVKKMEKLPGGWGIMADDVMAGAMSYIVLLFFYWIFN